MARLLLRSRHDLNFISIIFKISTHVLPATKENENKWSRILYQDAFKMPLLQKTARMISLQLFYSQKMTVYFIVQLFTAALQLFI